MALSLPPLEIDKKEVLSACIFPPFIGPGVLTVPFISISKELETFRHAQVIRDHFDVPLLRSEAVRKRIDACLAHPQQVALSLHKNSVSIRDYRHLQASVFYWDQCRDILEKSDPHELFRRLFVSFFPLFSSMLIHASCVVKNNRAALFLAPDEGGKTTAVKMAQGGTVLGDDRILVRKQGKDFVAYGTPWGTISDPDASARVAAVFFLNKSDKFRLSKVSIHRAVEYLWHEHRYDRFFLPKTLCSAVFEIIVDLCRQVHIYQMDFPKDYVDWNAVDAAMEGDCAA